jgi:hypothetical protein
MSQRQSARINSNAQEPNKVGKPSEAVEPLLKPKQKKIVKRVINEDEIEPDDFSQLGGDPKIILRGPRIAEESEPNDSDSQANDSIAAGIHRDENLMASDWRISDSPTRISHLKPFEDMIEKSNLRKVNLGDLVGKSSTQVARNLSSKPDSTAEMSDASRRAAAGQFSSKNKPSKPSEMDARITQFLSDLKRDKLGMSLRIRFMLNLIRQFLVDRFRFDETVEFRNLMFPATNRLAQPEAVNTDISIQSIWMETELLFKKAQTNFEEADVKVMTNLNVKIGLLARSLTIPSGTSDPVVDFLVKGGFNHHSAMDKLMDLADNPERGLFLSDEYPQGHALSNKLGIAPDRLLEFRHQGMTYSRFLPKITSKVNLEVAKGADSIQRKRMHRDFAAQEQGSDSAPPSQRRVRINAQVGSEGAGITTWDRIEGASSQSFRDDNSVDGEDRPPSPTDTAYGKTAGLEEGEVTSQAPSASRRSGSFGTRPSGLGSAREPRQKVYASFSSLSAGLDASQAQRLGSLEDQSQQFDSRGLSRRCPVPTTRVSVILP